jgi:hypothetical protein
MDVGGARLVVGEDAAAAVAAKGLGVGGHGSEMTAEFIEHRIEELQNSLKKLIESNQLLEEEDPMKQDSDFQEAITENRVLIEKRRGEIKQLLDELNQYFPHAAELFIAKLNSLPVVEEHKQEPQPAVVRQEPEPEEQFSNDGPTGLYL